MPRSSANSLNTTCTRDLRDHIARQRDRLMHMAALLGHVDYWQGLAGMRAPQCLAMPELSDKIRNPD